MSYDLFFFSKPGAIPATDKALSNYFSSRSHYELNQQSAWYNNESTGVYFGFDWQKPTDDELEQYRLILAAENNAESVLFSAQYDAAFNLNFFRPHPFAIEAEPEISALVQAFDFLVSVPPGEDGAAEYNREVFLRAWNEGNRFAYQAINEQQDPDTVLLSLPSTVIHSSWEWNKAREQLENTLGVFVPSIMFCLFAGELKTLVAWPDAIPVAVPPVDLLILGRDDLGNSPGALSSAPPLMAVVEYDQLCPQLQSYPLREGPLPYRYLSYLQPPQHLVEFFLEQPDMKEQPAIVGFDQVLNQELLVPEIRQSRS